MRADLLAADVPEKTIDARVTDRFLHPFMGRGAYLVGHDDPPPLAREYAAMRLGGEKAVLSHWTAGRLWRLVQAPGQVHLILPAQRRDTDTIIFHRGRLLRRELRTLHEDLRVTSPARTIADLAPHLPDEDLERIVADAIRRELTSEKELARYATRRRGAARLRAVLQLEGGPQWTRSKAEAEFLKLVREAGLPAPKLNKRRGGKGWDAVWDEHEVIAEIDGWKWHGVDAVAFEADRRRNNERIAAGWLPLRFTWKRMRDDRLAVAAELAVALSRARATQTSRPYGGRSGPALGVDRSAPRAEMCGDWAAGWSCRRHPSSGRCRPCRKVCRSSGLMCTRRRRRRRFCGH